MSATAITYSVRRSDRARRIRVTVDAERGVVVVLPRRAATDQADAAIRELTPWIHRRLAELERTAELVGARGDRLPLLGAELVLHPQQGRTRAHRQGDQLLVPAEPEARRHAIELWLRRLAREEFTARADRACAISGLRYTKLTVRGQRTRWGSATSAGALNFNWRLLLAPEPVLDYVVWHEVCHLAVMDHSERFWALVGRHCPDHRAHAAWLRRRGATLVL